MPKISQQDIFEALVQINQAFSEDQYWLLFRTHLNGFDEIAKRLRRNDVFSLLKRKTAIGHFKFGGVSLGLRRGVGQ